MEKRDEQYRDTEALIRLAQVINAKGDVGEVEHILAEDRDDEPHRVR